jgi:hypothetical protein
MKTPREILLARHQAATPKLDAVRQRALTALPSASGAGISTAAATRSARLSHYLEAAREFLLRPRLAWSALVVAWLVIITLNFATPETSAPGSALATATPPATPETLQALREQKRLLFTELGVGTLPPDAETPRFIPRPRSERQPLTACA